MRQRDRNTWLVTIAALLTAVFAVGGALRWSVVAFAVLSAAALALQITSHRRLSAWPPLLALSGVAAALTALQLIPLPIAVLELVNPTAHGLLVDGAAAAGEKAPAFAPLSLDPPVTLLELVKLSSYLALAYVLLRLAASERGRIRLFAATTLTIGAAAAIGLINKLLEAHTLYGLYRPRYAYAEFLGPLLNRNHFASLLAVGTLLAGGLALRARVLMQERFLWAVVGTLCLVESLLIQSRGAAIGLALGLGLAGGILLLQRWFEGASRRASRPDLAKVTLPATIVVLCGLTMVVFFSAGGVGEQLADTTTAELSEPRSKYVAWRSGATLVEESPWVGVGRGGFESAFTRVHPGSGFFTYSHLENEYLQAVVDWGVPGAVALALVAAWMALFAFRRWNGGALAASGLGALLAVAAHSVVDFGIEMPGLAVPIIIVLATLTYVPVTDTSSERAGRARRMRGGAVVLLGLGVLALATPLGRTLHEDHERLREQEAPLSADLGREVMRRHPVDYLAAAYVAAALYREGNAAARDLLNHALRLHPTHPDLHRLAGRLLLRSGKPMQALIEYRLAITATANPVEVLRELVKRFPLADQANMALPTDHLFPYRLARILADEGRPDVAVRYLRRVIEERPVQVATLRLLVEIAGRTSDRPAAEIALQHLAALEPTQDNYLELGKVLLAQKKYAEAEKAVRQAIEKHGPFASTVQAHVLLADVLIEAERWAPAREELMKMRNEPELYIAARKDIHRRLAVVEDALGHAREAEVERQRAKGP